MDIEVQRTAEALDQGYRAGTRPLASEPGLLDQMADELDQVLDYDRTCFPALRPAFLGGWIGQPEALSLGCRRDGGPSGYGVVRRCGEDCKVGPLFTDDAQAAGGVGSSLRRRSRPS